MTSSESLGRLFLDERLRNADWMMRIRVALGLAVIVLDLGFAADLYRARLLPILLYVGLAVALVVVARRVETVRKSSFLAVTLLDIPLLVVAQMSVIEGALESGLHPVRFGGLIGFSFAVFLLLVLLAQLSLSKSAVLMAAIAGLIGQVFLMHVGNYPGAMAYALMVMVTVPAAVAAVYMVHRVHVLLDRAARWYSEVTELNATLEARVEQRTAELREAQAQLVQSEKMASLGQLVAGVAHDLNTPVGSLRSSADTISSAISKLEIVLASHDISDRKIERTVTVLKRASQTEIEACDRVTRVVDTLRSFSRLDEAARKRASVNEGLDTTLSLLDHRMAGRVEVVRRFDDVPEIVCYPNELNQAFMSLLVNAIEAIEGEGTITVATRAVDDELVIEVADTGGGIDADHRDKIFDPGFTTKGVGTGGGLGLSIAYQIIAKHDGRIELVDTSDEGTTLAIHLPLDEAETDG